MYFALVAFWVVGVGYVDTMCAGLVSSIDDVCVWHLAPFGSSVLGVVHGIVST